MTYVINFDFLSLSLIFKLADMFLSIRALVNCKEKKWPFHYNKHVQVHTILELAPHAHRSTVALVPRAAVHGRVF